MSTTPTVGITTEANSRMKQWGRGLFYYKDGGKRTLANKPMIYTCAGALGAIAIAMLAQDPPSPAEGKTDSALLPPTEIKDGSIVLQSAESATAIAAAGQTESVRTSRLLAPQVIARPRLFKVPPGAMVKAVLTSGASNGPVRAEIVESFSFAGETVLSAGTTLLGSGQSNDGRLKISFRQLIARDGTIESVEAQACDASDKIPGLKGSQVGSQAARLGLGMGLNFIGGLSQNLQDTQTVGGVTITAPNLKDALLNGAATAALDQSREVMSDLRNRPPVYEIQSGTPIFILFQKD